MNFVEHEVKYYKEILKANVDWEETWVKQANGFICLKEMGICDSLLSIHQLTFPDTCYISPKNFSGNHSTQFKNVETGVNTYYPSLKCVFSSYYVLSLGGT